MNKFPLKLLTFLISAVFASLSVSAQQVPDTAYTPPAFTARYATGSGGIVMIDEAHHNFHTAAERYAPFAKVLARDGYQIKRGTETFSKQSLEGVKILVIANALNAVNERQWKLPTPSAFTESEIAAVKEWVNQGGSLFLIADHMPFAGAAADLAAAVGYHFYNGFALNEATVKKGQPDMFYRKDNSFNPGTLPGLDGVDSIATFTGQGFTPPADAVSVINLDARFNILMPETAWKFNKKTERISGAGKSQGAYSSFGKGRVVAFGEAAMFSAQKMGTHGAGMNTPQGSHNYLLLLALVHWLDDAGK